MKYMTVIKQNHFLILKKNMYQSLIMIIQTVIFPILKISILRKKLNLIKLIILLKFMYYY